MNRTATQHPTGAVPAPRAGLAERRSVRGTVAALSQIAAVGGRALNVLRLQSMAAVGDHIHLTYGTAADARTAAALLHLPASSHSRAIVGSGRTLHVWRGDVAELTVTVEGYGVLSEETPDRLVADVLAARPEGSCPVCWKPWRGHDNDECERSRDLGPCPDDVHAALVGDQDAAVTR